MNNQKMKLALTRGLKHLVSACMLSLIVSIGCTPKPVAVIGDEQQVRVAVTEMLDAWQKGTSLGDFTAEHPEVVVADEEWQVGVPLKSYTIGEAAERSGGHWRQRVELNFAKRSKGKVTVHYAVTLADKTVILRSDVNH
jgi:hypothetical protein